jgi:hypothetical protein
LNTDSYHTDHLVIISLLQQAKPHHEKTTNASNLDLKEIFIFCNKILFMSSWYLASDLAELEYLLENCLYFLILAQERQRYKFSQLKVLQIKYFLPMLCNWYTARLAGYQFLESPAWYKSNFYFMSNFHST